MAFQYRRVRKSKNRRVRRKISLLVTAFTSVVIILLTSLAQGKQVTPNLNVQEHTVPTVVDMNLPHKTKTQKPHRTIMTTLEPVSTGEEVTEEEFELLANLCRAEAGNQGVLGMRYVVCCVLNRRDSEDFPDSIREVVFQKRNGRAEFSCTTDGGLQRWQANEESREAVRLELAERSNDKILFFRTGHYHGFGSQLFRYKDHYFSGK